MPAPYFISYSTSDSPEFALKLREDLLAGEPPIHAWIDRYDIPAGVNWDNSIRDALSRCRALIFVMSPDSLQSEICTSEWTRVLRNKKPIIPIVHLPFDENLLQLRLENRHRIDFSNPNDYETALARLRKHVRWLDTNEGKLESLKQRKSDAEHDLRRARSGGERLRIEEDLDEINRQVKELQFSVDHPDDARRRKEQRVEAGLQRARQPEKPVSGRQTSKFINRPPDDPRNFQGRADETRAVGQFLQQSQTRLLNVIGRAGIGKTALICRVLKHVQAGRLPDECGTSADVGDKISRNTLLSGSGTPVEPEGGSSRNPTRQRGMNTSESESLADASGYRTDGVFQNIGGIIYESCLGKSRLEPDQILNDLLRLHPSPEEAEQLKSDWQTRQLPPDARFERLLEVLPDGRVIVLLDNFEDLLSEDRRLGERNAGLLQTLTAVLALPDHDVQVILTSRVPVYDLALEHPERQSDVEMTHGLQTQHAAELLRSLDEDGRLGLRDASDAQLERACVTTLGNPRGLLAVFGALRADREATLDEVLDEAERALHAEQKADATSGAVDKVVDAVVGTAFARLDEPAQQVMQALAVYARPVPATAVDWLWESTDRDAQPVLTRLVNMKLVHSEPGGYGLHPLDRAHALRSLNPHPESNGDGALRPLQLRAADWFAHSRTPRETWNSIADLAPQLAEIELRIAVGDYDAAADIVSDIDFHFLLLWGHADRVLELRTRLEGNVKDGRRRQRNAGLCANALMVLGRVREAITAYEDALALSREQLDRRGEGAWLGSLGNAYADLGEVRRAIEFLEQALDIARDIGHSHAEVAAVGSLGLVYSDLGEKRRAIESYERALDIAREIGDRQNEGSCLCNIGLEYLDLGETRRAIEFYEQALDIAQEIGDRRGETIRLGNLGTAYLALGEAHRAIHLHEQAIDIADEIGSVDVQQESRAALARLRLDQGANSAAIELAGQAVTFDVPLYSSEAWQVQGTVLLYAGTSSATSETDWRKTRPASPQKSFDRAAQTAQRLIDACEENFRAHDWRGLALCGLAVCAASESPAHPRPSPHGARGSTGGRMARRRRIRLPRRPPAKQRPRLAPRPPAGLRPHSRLRDEHGPPHASGRHSPAS